MLALIHFKLLAIALICALTSSAHSAIKSENKDINTNFVKLYERFDYLIDRVTELLTELVAHHKKGSTCDLEHALSDECSSMCHARADRWANETKLSLRHSLDTLDPFISDNVTPHQKLVNVCEPNPCQHGGRCELTGSGYICKDCPYMTGGINCKEIYCSNSKCFIRNEVYYEFNEIAANWDEANRKCQEHGMTMVTMKDKETSDFIQTKARSLYKAGTDYFWVGLTPNAVAKQWEWVDGSPLGEYRGINPYKDIFKTFTVGHCCLMYLETQYVFCHPNLYCANTYYSICEKRLSAA